MSLDDKLREILIEEVDKNIEYGEGVNANYYGIDFDEIIAQIKQAFADEGYVKVAKDNQDKIKTATIYSIEFGLYELMTGQEWYERFTDYIYDIPSVQWGDKTEDSQKEWGENHADLWIPQREAIKAAKRASGIEDEQ